MKTTYAIFDIRLEITCPNCYYDFNAFNYIEIEDRPEIKHHESCELGMECPNCNEVFMIDQIVL